MASRYEDKQPRPNGAISTQETSILFMDSRKTVPNDFHEPKQPRHPGLSQACSQELEIEKPSHDANDHERTSTAQQTQRKSRRQGNARRPSDHVCQMKTGAEKANSICIVTTTWVTPREPRYKIKTYFRKQVFFPQLSRFYLYRSTKCGCSTLVFVH
jgi:hypothetical protein